MSSMRKRANLGWGPTLADRWTAASPGATAGLAFSADLCYITVRGNSRRHRGTASLREPDGRVLFDCRGQRTVLVSARVKDAPLRSVGAVERFVGRCDKPVFSAVVWLS
ncbi:hypothetical protein MTO96_032308 [Rhipicephalus appendiculatus]